MEPQPVRKRNESRYKAVQDMTEKREIRDTMKHVTTNAQQKARMMSTCGEALSRAAGKHFLASFNISEGIGFFLFFSKQIAISIIICPKRN